MGRLKKWDINNLVKINDDQKSAQCFICKKNLSIHTGNIKRHYWAVHNTALEEINVSQPQQRPPELSADEQLFNLLCEIDQYNYDYLFERCKECNVNARQLKYFGKDHVRQLIPKANLGVLAEFEYLLEDWKLKNGPNYSITEYYPAAPKFSPKPGSSGGDSGGGSKHGKLNSARPKSQSDEVTFPGHVLPDNDKAFEQQLEDVSSNASAYQKLQDSIEDSLMTSATCSEEEKEGDEDKEQDGGAINRYNLGDIIPTELKKCQERYNANRNILNEMDRRKISTAIIEYFKRHSIPLTSKRIEHLADQIVQYFPTENKRSWFDRRDGKRCGRLYSKPHEAKKRKKMTLRDFEEVTVESILSNISENENKNEFMDADEFMDEDVNQDYVVMEGFQKWLKCNKFEDWEDVMNMWTNSVSYRKRQLYAIDAKTEESLSRILSDWPAYVLPTGYQLINIDFNDMYPKSEAAFSQRWRVYMEKMSTLMMTKLKDDTSLELFKEFRRLSSTISKDSREAVLMKLLHAIIIPSNHYSISEAQLSTIRRIEYISELDNFSEAKPCIFLLGSGILQVDKCFVAFRNIRYELPFVEALRTCFQIYTIFKLDFPLPSTNFWSFVSTYFFNIPKKSDMQYPDPVMDGIMNYLNTFESV